MNLDATTYFRHLRAYVNDRYVLPNGDGGEVVLQEKYFPPPPATRAETRKLRLLLPGPGLAFKLDQDQIKLRKKKIKPPLFHFLDDNAKPWSKRCDFVIFYVNRRAFCADCIEFKSGSIAGSAAREQLRAGACWVRSLKRTIEHYTEDTRKIRVRKFLFGDKQDAHAYLDSDRQLNADPSIRYYHFDEVQGQSLTALQNHSVQVI